MFVSSVYSPARPHLQRTVYSALWSLSFSIFIIPCVICTQDPLVQLGFVSFVLNLVWQTFEDKWSHIETKQNCLVDIHMEASYSWSSGQNFFLDFCFILFKICLMMTVFEGVHLLFPLNFVLYHLQCLTSQNVKVSTLLLSLSSLVSSLCFSLLWMKAVTEIKNGTLHPVTKHCSTRYS